MKHDDKSTGLFSDEEEGYNLEEETKYKLKLDAPSEPASSVSDDEESLDAFADAEGDEELSFGDDDKGGDEKPFDDEPFDAGVEADEDEDPEKFIQQLAGKLGTSLRKYNDERGEPDFDLEKYAINSVISATHTAEMEEEDQKDIIKKVKMSGAGDENDDVDKDLDMDSEEPKDEEPMGDELGFGDDEDIEEGLYEDENPCWDGYEMVGMKEKDGKEVPNCVPVNETITEAEYKGRKVTLNKPTKGDSKKFKVYVKNDKGNVVKVEFGDPKMEIRRDNDEARKSFRARHKCSEKKDKTTAGYWSCKMWSNKKVSDITENLDNSEKSPIFEENFDMKDVILHNLHETTKPAPVREKPAVVPEREKSPSPRRRRIWETKPSVKPNPKMEEGKIVNVQKLNDGEAILDVIIDGKLVKNLTFENSGEVVVQPMAYDEEWVYNYVAEYNDKEYAVGVGFFGHPEYNLELSDIDDHVEEM